MVRSNLPMTPSQLAAYQNDMEEFFDPEDPNIFPDSDDDETIAAGKDVGSCGWTELKGLEGLVKKCDQMDCVASLRNQPQV